jgi:hypothetical protein
MLNICRPFGCHLTRKRANYAKDQSACYKKSATSKAKQEEEGKFG